MQLKLSILFGFCLIAGLAAMDCDLFNDAYLAVDKLISRNSSLIPTIVRLSFHDCLGESCDGCINLRLGSNRGLDDAVAPLNALYERKGFDDHMSRADFWQLAAHVALVRGGLNQRCEDYDDDECPFFHNQFHWGREDCSTSPDYKGHEEAGNGNGGFDELWRILHGDFGFDAHEIVTILGAHSLGGAARKNSGFVLNWQKSPLVFDNQYYENMVTLPYSHVDVAQGRSPKPRKEFIFEDGHPPVMMLNTDMSLWKELIPVEEDGHYTGDVKCPVKGSLKRIPDDAVNFVYHCEDSDTAEQVEEYAADVSKFFDDFPYVYQKMVAHGYDRLYAPKDDHGDKCGYCIPTGGYCEEGFGLSGSCCDGHCSDNKCRN